MYDYAMAERLARGGHPFDLQWNTRNGFVAGISMKLVLYPGSVNLLDYLSNTVFGAREGFEAVTKVNGAMERSAHADSWGMRRRGYTPERSGNLRAHRRWQKRESCGLWGCSNSV